MVAKKRHFSRARQSTRDDMVELILRQMISAYGSAIDVLDAALKGDDPHESSFHNNIDDGLSWAISLSQEPWSQQTPLTKVQHEALQRREQILSDLKKLENVELESLLYSLREHEIFNASDMQASAPNWARKPFWTPQEFAALSFGIEPSKLTADFVKEWTSRSTIVANYLDVEDTAPRAISTGDLSSHSPPKSFVEWALKRNISFPQDLQKAVASLSSASSENQQLSVDQDQILALKAQVQMLKKEIEEAQSRPKPTCWKVIFALCLFDRSEGPKAIQELSDTSISFIVQKVQNNMLLLGLKADDQSVRNTIRAANKYIKDSYKKHSKV